MCCPSSSSTCRPGKALALVLGALSTLGISAAVQAFSPLSGPVLSASPVPPNVVMLFDNSSSMVLNTVPGTRQTRLAVAREAAQDIMAVHRNLRFGLFAFRDTQGNGRNRNAPGGRLLVEVGSIDTESEAGRTRFTRLNQALDRLDPSTRPDRYTYTPLAESYYEITRYMRGLPAFYPRSASAAGRDMFVSPIDYRCQKNFGLILTDGLPTYDSEFPHSLDEDPDASNPLVDRAFNLPNWDGSATGDTTGDDLADEGSTFFLDDIAAFAYATDMRNTARIGVSTDLAGESFDDESYAAQNMRTFTVGFAVDDPRLRRVADVGNGEYYTASNRSELSAALHSALAQMNATAGAGGGGVASSSELTDQSLFYRSRYDPSGWAGTIEAFRLDAAGQLGAMAWSSDTTVTSGDSALYQTWRTAERGRPGAALVLDGSSFAQLSDTQRQLIHAEAGQAGLTGDDAGQRLLDWARGASIAGLRDRDVLLGDIINAPVVLFSASQVLAPANADGYAAYRAAKRAGMTPSLVTGSNDGMVHVLGAADGAHRYAFLPAAMHRHLGNRARADFGEAHESGMDGPITLADVHSGSSWSTVAVGGMGAGGKGLFGIRLFDQARGDRALGALWEVNAADEGWEDLGYTYAKPIVTQLDGRWVVLSGNGYGGSTGQAVLYVLDAYTGAQLARIAVGEAGANGLSSLQIARDAQGDVSAAYAGDLQGRLWKFELTGSAGEWTGAFAGQPLFASDDLQPVTVQPQLVAHPQGGHLVLFASGKFLERADLTDRSLHSFYAVWDRPGDHGGLDPEDLLEQRITDQSQRGGQHLRSVSQERVDWHSHRGWRLPLVYDGNAQGERVYRPFVTRGSRVIFTTGLIDVSEVDPCVTHADGWLMVLDIYSGAMLPRATLDTNGDRLVDGTDEPTAGLDLDVGLPGDLNLVRRPRPSCEELGTCECTEGEECPPPPPCGDEYYLLPGSSDVASIVGNSRCEFRRIMWRQLM